jgi:hypothetical protein
VIARTLRAIEAEGASGVPGIPGDNRLLLAIITRSTLPQFTQKNEARPTSVA